MPKILIVDDDPDVVQACRLFLEKEGYTVASAHNRAEGKRALTEQKPDLLILDVMMEEPDDGIAMAQELRREGVGIPILMLTSLVKVTGMEYGRDSEVLPVDEFVEKPIAPAKLIAKVKNLLGK
jgi:DNA-binding response OmpR family regulator